MHEQRYFSQGEPTKLVRDQGQESYDPPPQNGLGRRQAHVEIDTRVDTRANGAAPGPAQAQLTYGQAAPSGQPAPAGWWLASDGNWYPPELASPGPEPAPVVEPAPIMVAPPATPPVAQEPPVAPPVTQPAEPTPPPGWWLASDGNWYPPELASPAPAESSAHVVPPVSQPAEPTPPPGWWLASDGNWYPPELAPR
jgi:hypothetical protein